MSLALALNRLPVSMNSELLTAFNEGGEMANEMLVRDEMPPERALLAGLALDPKGRPLVEGLMDSYAEPEAELPTSWGEVIVGGGAHAAIYAAVRHQLGFERPLVLERNRRFGGTFAMTERSSFFLNSRNRPGPLGAVGSRDALNVIPGAMMQPSDLGGSEYQANADLGLVVRCTLALNAVVRQADVQEVAMNGENLVVITGRGAVVAKRVIVATGIGAPKDFVGAPFNNKQVLSFDQFMERFDQTRFPLRDLGRVAVVGGGDSGRTAVEALSGYGPYMGGSVASLDYVPQIDWYGIEPDMTKERWLDCNRTRYKPLAALFPKRGEYNANARVRGFDRLTNIYSAYDAVRIDGNSYDTVIGCKGFTAGTQVDCEGADKFELLKITENGGPALARVNDKQTLFVVGPAADFPWKSGEDPEPRIEENRVALFRLAPRTAALASRLAGV